MKKLNISNVQDIQRSLTHLQELLEGNERAVISSYNYLWRPFVKAKNWISSRDLENLLILSDLDLVTRGTDTLIPLPIPLVSHVLNLFLAKLPLIRHLCLVQYVIVRKKPNLSSHKQYSVSVIVPARNEQGTIKSLIKRVPKMGRSTELIFVEGHSTDKTYTEIQKIVRARGRFPMRLYRQRGVGKADAVRLGFKMAKGEILMILDADLSVMPEDLSKFYEALRLRKGDLVMGNRLMYPLQEQSMQFLNILANKFFSLVFSWILDQQVKDTLCGTKILFKSDYERIVQNRKYFGNFDPFGDFDLILGSSRLNFKILEIPVQYHARTYGQTNISRFRHGLLLLKMTFFAAFKIKFTNRYVS